MRNILMRYVLEYLPEADTLGAIYDKANGRRNNDDPTSQTSIVSYLDMQEVYDCLNQHRAMLPEELGRELRSNTPLLNQLVPLRNRVMHGRPLKPGDPENAINACIAFSTRYWPTVGEVLNHLRSDPTWEPAFGQQPRLSERTLQNLPLPEYDETGLIGRESDCRKIVGWLLKRREPIITIRGEGGIGKTALALEVAYSILDNADSPYECILWVSLKAERLTATGVAAISNAVRDLTGIAVTLGQGIVEDFSGNVQDLAMLLEGIQTLIIIDNLESIDGSEVLELYDALPDSVNYLFTSRIGVGQSERKYELGPLPERDAAVLFRSLAKARGLDNLAKLPSETIGTVVKRLRYSPLAIRWYLLAVEAGERPDPLTDQSALLDFCVRSVFNAMQPNAKLILTTLFALDRIAEFDELAILTDMQIDDLRRAVHDLLNGSTVILEPDRDRELVSGIRLTETARSFLRKVEVPQNTEVERILARELEFRKSEERRKTDEQGGRLAPNAVRVRSDSDKPTAHLLRLALLASREESTERALELTSRARALNPEYWEVDRVEAFILSQAGQVVQATAVYRSALRNADDEGRAVVSYFFAGHLARKAHEVEPSIEFARKANDYFDNAETAQQLGTFLVWNQQFDEGQEFLITALENANGRLRLITLTSLINSWSRWAEFVHKHDRRSTDSAHKAYTGFAIGAKEIRLGTYDNRLANAVLESCTMLLRCITTGGVEAIEFSRELSDVLSLITKYRRFFEHCTDWQFFARQIGYLYRSPNVPSAIKELCTAVVDLVPEEIRPPRATGVLTGEICGWHDTYGFISNPNYKDNIFFHISVVEDPALGSTRPLVGRRVRFTVMSADGHRVKADWVKFL